MITKPMLILLATFSFDPNVEVSSPFDQRRSWAEIYNAIWEISY